MSALGISTCGTKHMTVEEFAVALAEAEPGDRIVYAIGNIAWSAGTADAEELRKLRLRAYLHYLDGSGYLTQLRLRDSQFLPKREDRASVYLFTIPSPRGSAPIRKREVC